MSDTPSSKSNWTRWLKLGLIFIGFLILSIGLGFLFRWLLAHYKIPLDIPLWLGLLVLFGIMVVVNVSILPLPFGVSLMLVAAGRWNPVLVAFVGSLGASLGEFSSYFFGYLSKRFSIDENMFGYKLIQGWISKYGMWAIAFLSFQPILPFEVGGFIAGLTKMPARKFLPAIIIGKFPKYLILIYLGDIVFHWLHINR